MQINENVKEKLNYSKYGFILHNVESNNLLYISNVEGETIELKVVGDYHTLKITGKRNIMVANRYKIVNQKQLDFILVNGRTGVLFSPLSGSNKV